MENTKWSHNESMKLLYSQLVGQQHARRVLEIAAAGSHSVLLIGTELQQVSLLKELGCFLHISTMRHKMPCACGFYGDTHIECTCEPNEVYRHSTYEHYDICIRLATCTQKELLDSVYYNKHNYENISLIVDRVSKVDKDLSLQFDVQCDQLLTSALGSCRWLNYPSYMGSTLEVAQTIAKLDNSKTVRTIHLAEAIAYLPK